MAKDIRDPGEMAETIALQMLAFLASDEERLQAFLVATGFELEALREMAQDPEFLGGVADYLLADQSLLLIFCEQVELDPNWVISARRHLPGASA